jgi:hypothetical protein
MKLRQIKPEKSMTGFGFIKPLQMYISLHRELLRLEINHQKSMANGFHLFSFSDVKKLTILAIRLSAFCKIVFYHLKYFQKIKVLGFIKLITKKIAKK